VAAKNLPKSKPRVRKPAAPKPRKLTSAEILDAVGEDVLFARIANCEFIHKIAASVGVSETQFHAWLDKRPELYAHARERQADKLVADMVQIADDGRNDTFLNDRGERVIDQDVVARSRLRIDARKWLAGKMSKRYGEKLDVEHKGAFTVTITKDDASVG
jgi:hypothetical protein